MKVRHIYSLFITLIWIVPQVIVALVKILKSDSGFLAKEEETATWHELFCADVARAFDSVLFSIKAKSEFAVATPCSVLESSLRCLSVGPSM